MSCGPEPGSPEDNGSSRLLILFNDGTFVIYQCQSMGCLEGAM